jgi:hypothetical protein
MYNTSYPKLWSRSGFYPAALSVPRGINPGDREFIWLLTFRNQGSCNLYKRFDWGSLTAQTLLEAGCVYHFRHERALVAKTISQCSANAATVRRLADRKWPYDY